MPGPEEIPDVPAFVVLRAVVGRWLLVVGSVVGRRGTRELNSEASLQRISQDGGWVTDVMTIGHQLGFPVLTVVTDDSLWELSAAAGCR